jgi:hypothetical protein
MEGSEDESDHGSGRFPLSVEDIANVTMVIKLVRSQLPSMTPRQLRTAAVLLRALERLPEKTPGIYTTFGFVQRSDGGNYGWADISISEDEFRLGLGEHFYEPSVGGDTESRNAFEAIAGADWPDGDIDEWLSTAQVLSVGAEISIQDDSDYDAIDWSSETERDRSGDPEPPPRG